MTEAIERHIISIDRISIGDYQIRLSCFHIIQITDHELDSRPSMLRCRQCEKEREIRNNAQKRRK